MNKGIAIQTGLSIALAVLFIIAASLIIKFMFPFLTKGSCMKGQRGHIEEIDSLSKDANMTTASYTLKFKVEDCVECMWYFFNATIQGDQLKIRWDGMSTTDSPVLINTTVPWNIGDNAGGNNQKCSNTPGDNLKGNNVYVFEIKSNAVDILPS